MKKSRLLILVGMLFAAVLMLAGCRSTTVNLNDYISVEFIGYDTMGEAEVVFDYDAFNEDYGGEIEVNEDSGMAAMGMMAGDSAPELLIDFCVNRSLSQRTGLSNGDVVTLTWNCEDQMAEDYFDCKLEYSDIEYTVEGLTEVELFNPFDYVEIGFSGVSPAIQLTFTPDETRPEMGDIRFSADQTRLLQNGDTVTVYAEITVNGGLLVNDSYNEPVFVERYGEVLSETEKTITIESLPYYISSVDEIPTDLMDEMVAEGESRFRAYVNEEWSNSSDLMGVAYEGNYFLTAKEAGYIGNMSDGNRLYLVYRITALNHETNQPMDFYYYARFTDIIMQADGTCTVDFENCAVPQTGWFSSSQFSAGGYTYAGYSSLDAFYEDCVESHPEYYNYTSTIQ